MKPKKYGVYLTGAERKELEKIVNQSKHTATVTKRANVLLNLDENQGRVLKQEEIGRIINVSTVTIMKISKEYVKKGLSSVIELKKRSVPPVKPLATGEVEAQIITLACTAPPEGRGR